MRKLITAFVLLLTSFAAYFDIAECQAITQKGTRCKRSGEPYCWQHGGSSSSSSKTQPDTPSATSSSTATPKSYQVYEQRNSQGPRTFSKAMRRQKFREQNGYCAYCKKKCNNISEMHGDHIKPYSKGEKTEYSNLQMLYPTCNLKKSTLLLILGIFWGMCSYCYAETFNYEPDFSKSIIIVISSLIWKYIVKFMIWWNHE